MKSIPITPQTLSVAPRIIWFEPPEQALANPIRFMAGEVDDLVMRLATDASDHDFATPNPS